MHYIASYYSDWIWPAYPLKHYAILGATMPIVSICADLFESFLKRCADVKVPHLFSNAFRILEQSCLAMEGSLTE